MNFDLTALPWGVLILLALGQMGVHLARSLVEPPGPVRLSSPLVIAGLPLVGPLGALGALLLGQIVGSVLRREPHLRVRPLLVDLLALLLAGVAETQVMGDGTFEPDLPFDYLAIGTAIAVYLAVRWLAARLRLIETSGEGAFDALIPMAPAVTIAYDASPLAAYLVLPALVGAYVVRGLNYRVRRTEEALRLERQRILQARAVAGAQESERARIARDLHDGPLQEVIAARRMVEAGLNERAVSVLAEAVQHLREAIYDVHPSVLQLGLPVALRALGARHASLEVHLQVSDPPPPLSEDQQLAVYRIVSEALSNVERHAQAHAAWIRLEAQGGELVVTVQDDGLGLPLKASGRGLGLVSMRERAEALGGQLSLSSNAQGTRVEARLPLRDTAIGLEA